MVAIELVVFLRSVDDSGGDSGFLLEELRESHEKGLVSFLAGAGAGAEVCFSATVGAGGGGGNFTGETVPERPCSPLSECRGGSLGTSGVGFGASVNRVSPRSLPKSSPFIINGKETVLQPAMC